MYSCIGDLAANIHMDCNNPLEGGYTGRAIIMTDEVFSTATITRDAQNKRIIKSFGEFHPKAFTVDNITMVPFDGSSTNGNGDAGYPKFVKAMVIRIPERGAAVAKDIIEPLAFGRFVMVVEKVDKNGDGSFEVIGSQSALRCVDPSTITRQETANGGAWSATLQCTEQYAEVVWLDTDYATTKAAFDAWFTLYDEKQ